MKKSIFLPALFFLPMMLLVGGCSGSRPAYGPAPAAPTAPSSSTPADNGASQSQVPAQPSQPGNNQTSAKPVTIQNFAFSPASMTVAKGATVTWTNQDSVPHQIASDTNAFGGPAISQGGTYSFTFNDTGTFPYHCTIHPSMKGTITVQ